MVLQNSNGSNMKAKKRINWTNVRSVNMVYLFCQGIHWYSYIQMETGFTQWSTEAALVLKLQLQLHYWCVLMKWKAYVNVSLFFDHVMAPCVQAIIIFYDAFESVCSSWWTAELKKKKKHVGELGSSGPDGLLEFLVNSLFTASSIVLRAHSSRSDKQVMKCTYASWRLDVMWRTANFHSFFKSQREVGNGCTMRIVCVYL